eukprot:1190663-Pleurochrysis_carterae.AAC.4
MQRRRHTMSNRLQPNEQACGAALWGDDWVLGLCFGTVYGETVQVHVPSSASLCTYVTKARPALWLYVTRCWSATAVAATALRSQGAPGVGRHEILLNNKYRTEQNDIMPRTKMRDVWRFNVADESNDRLNCSHQMRTEHQAETS